MDAFAADEESRLRATVGLAAGRKPDQVAGAKRTAEALGTPLAAVEALPEDAARQAKVQQVLADTSQAPVLRQRYTDADFAALAHDDSGALADVEKWLKYAFSHPSLKNTAAGDLGAGLHEGSAGIAGVLRAGSEALAPLLDFTEATTPQEFTGWRGAFGGNPLRRLAEGFSANAETNLASSKDLSPAQSGNVASGVSSGIKSLAQNLTTLPLAFLPGGEAAALSGMVAMQGGQSYQQAREQGLPMSQALPFAVSQAAIEYATEKIPLTKLLGDVKGGAPILQTLLHQAATEIPGEQIATVLQDLNEWAVLPENAGKPFSAYLQERPGAAAQTLIATLIGTGGNIAVTKGLDAVTADLAAREAKAMKAEQGAQAFEQLGALAAASKVLQRDPETFQAFVEAAAENGPVQDVFISAEALAQSGHAEEAAAASPSVQAQFATALETGADIKIPVAEYATTIASQSYAQNLVDHLKVEADGFSRAEAQEFMKTQGEELRKQVETTLAANDGDAKLQAGREAVQAKVLEQLTAANRFTGEVNSQYASLVGAFYATQAERLGVTPEQMYERYPLRVQATSPVGAVLNQGKTLDSLRAGWADAGIKASVSESDDRITLSQIVVPEEGRGKGAGTKALQGLVAYADAVGKHVVLSPSADFGGNKARLVKFYKRFGFVENKGKNRAFSTMETMYRQAPGKVLEQGQRAAFTPGANIISLFKTADLSSFLHELGHFQLEVLADLASQPNAPEAVKADMQALLEWFGVKADTPEGALETWHRMTLDEKRQHHEQFARGFEAYLFEGTAPSIELRGIFQRFRAWLVSVYKQIKALNVTLTPEVRGVMDRLVATEDQIHNAEAAASMGLLFKTPEEAAQFGVDWQAYHDQADAATAAAMDDLAERGLKDMQWLSRAKGRELKKLQKAAESKRKEVEAEVRAEVMAQPVYQAWQYLTGKPTVELNDADKEALAQHAAALRAWKDKRAEAEKQAAADVKTELLAEHPDAKGLAKGQLLAKNKRQLDINAQQRMLEWDQANPKPVRPTPGPTAPVEADAYGKLNTEDVKARYGNAEGSITRKLAGEGMLKADGEDPDITAELFAYDSGDAMMQALAAAKPPEQAISEATDQRMLERYGDITSAQALETAANEAIHNIARAKFVATELAALQKANDARRDVGTDKKGRPRTVAILPEAARQFAADLIARLKVRDVSPGQYQAAEAKAGREAEKALKAGDVVGAAREKRNQLINHFATKEALAAQAEVAKALKYLARVEKSDTIDPEYRDQIAQLLERYSLARESLKAIDKRKSLKEWVAQQEAAGLVPEIPAALLEGIDRKSYRDMTVEEVRGLVDTVKQIEHIGRLKQKLLTARDQRTYEAIRDEIAASIIANGQGRQADTRTPTTNAGRWFQGVRNFGAAHIKAATWARIMDGNKDGGALWEHLIRSANERADQETTMRAEATQRLSQILAPVMKGVRSGKATFYPSIGRSYNREAVLAMALNTGNAGNLQRLLGGEGWTIEQLKPVLDTLTAQEWQAVQAVWDHFETYRPLIAAKERRVYGKEPKWIDPTPVVTKFGTLKGGYYPVKYDPAASARAEERADAEEAAAMLKGAYSSATTRRSFTKSRVESVVGRPLLYTMQGLYGGVNEVIHDLAWHEWLIDANRLMRSDKIDTAMRETYGPAAVRQFKTWREAIATGDAGTQEAIDKALGRLRQGVSIAGLGFNVMSAAMQPLGITQSIVRVGAKWIGKGVAQYAANPLAAGRLVQAQSEFMRNRARTRFRELNELRNQVQGQTVLKERLQANTFVLMMKAQQTVDIPTWLGAYEKGMSEKPDEDRAIALADQAVIDSQGGGQLKDLSAIERGGPAQKLFTVFYGFRNTALNLAVAQGMSERSAAKKAADMLLLSTVPAVLSYFLKNALTPGDSGDDDESLLKKLLAAQLSDLFGLFVVGREFADVAKIVTGTGAGDYTGPAGVRLVADTAKFAQQAAQLEFDDAFRRAAVNLTGDAFGLPAAQINRTITGAEALSEGDTQNPAALVFGFQRPH